jgi:predicted NBD/HSP70 family sugar kinase
VVAGTDVLDENLFGHGGAFGDRRCRCGRTGCLETVAAGWALPDPVGDDALRDVAEAVAVAVAAEPAARDATVIVVGGGMVRRYPNLVTLVQDALPTRVVEASAAPAAAKSAAAWGLRRLASSSYGSDAVIEGGRS